MEVSGVLMKCWWPLGSITIWPLSLSSWVSLTLSLGYLLPSTICNNIKVQPCEVPKARTCIWFNSVTPTEENRAINQRQIHLLYLLGETSMSEGGTRKPEAKPISLHPHLFENKIWPDACKLQVQLPSYLESNRLTTLNTWNLPYVMFSWLIFSKIYELTSDSHFLFHRWETEMQGQLRSLPKAARLEKSWGRAWN